MRCPACGAFYSKHSERCPECGAIQNGSSRDPFRLAQPEQMGMVEETKPLKTMEKRRDTIQRSPSLIEFPGVHRIPVPQWRKDLGERVREVHERRAREAILEAGGTERLFDKLEPNAAPMLELLPQAEAPPVNPLVVAALQRIERAHSQPGSNALLATAVAYDEQAEFGLELAPPEEEAVTAPKPERVHNLAVVPTRQIMTADISEELSIPREPRKHRKIIDDQNPALNYLDSVPRSVILEARGYRSAPIYLRTLGGLVDLLFVCLLSSPFLALTRLTNLEWGHPRVIGFALGTFLTVGFLYLTVSVAFTGRTIGLKLFSLRVVDSRTGLIPTGSQSAGRALLYMLSLSSAGIALLYAFVDSEKHTPHDHFTRTAVIRM